MSPPSLLLRPAHLLPRLAEIAPQIGARPPRGVTVLRAARVAHLRVDTDGAPLHLQLMFDDLDGYGFSAAPRAVGLPGAPPACRALPAQVLGVPALLGPMPHGRTATTDANPALGALTRRLGDIARAAWGTGALAPERASWRHEWLARVARRWARIVGAGLALAPLVPALRARIEALAPSLDTATRWGLVHGRLVPSNATVNAEGQLLAITGWEELFAGDPVAGLATALPLDGGPLRAWLRGYGASAIEALCADTDALARLEVYRLTDLLTLLAWLAAPTWPAADRARLLERVVHSAEVALAEPAGARLRRGLGDGDVPEEVDPPDSARDRVRQVVERLRFGPPPTERWGEVAFAAVLAARLWSGPAVAGWDRQVRAAVDALPGADHPRIESPSMSWEDLVRRAARRPDALVTVYAARCAFGVLGWRLDPSVRAGLEVLVERMLAGPPTEVDEVVAYAAARVLGRGIPGLPPPVAPVVAPLGSPSHTVDDAVIALAGQDGVRWAGLLLALYDVDGIWPADVLRARGLPSG